MIGIQNIPPSPFHTLLGGKCLNGCNRVSKVELSVHCARGLMGYLGGAISAWIGDGAQGRQRKSWENAKKLTTH